MTAELPDVYSLGNRQADWLCQELGLTVIETKFSAYAIFSTTRCGHFPSSQAVRTPVHLFETGRLDVCLHFAFGGEYECLLHVCPSATKEPRTVKQRKTTSKIESGKSLEAGR